MYVFAAILAFIIAGPWVVVASVPIILTFFLPIVVISFLTAELAVLRAHFARKPRVLVVDDEMDSVLPLISVLENNSTDVHYVASGQEMIRELANQQYDLVFLDSKMPEMSGEKSLEKCDEVLTLKRRLPVIFYSGSVRQVAVPCGLKQFDIKGIWSKFDLASLEKSVASIVGTPQRALVPN